MSNWTFCPLEWNLIAHRYVQPMDQWVFWIYTVVCKPMLIEIKLKRHKFKYPVSKVSCSRLSFHFLKGLYGPLPHLIFEQTGSIKKSRAGPSVKITYFALWSIKKYMWMQNFFPFIGRKMRAPHQVLDWIKQSFEKVFDGNNPEKTSLLEFNKISFKCIWLTGAWATALQGVLGSTGLLISTRNTNQCQRTWDNQIVLTHFLFNMGDL